MLKIGKRNTAGPSGDVFGKVYTASGLKAGTPAILYGNGAQLGTATVDGTGKATWALAAAIAADTFVFVYNAGQLSALSIAKPPVPALPLPAGSKVVAMGDSHMGFNSAGFQTFEKGLVMAAWSLDPRFNFDSFVVPGAAAGANGNPSTAGNTGGANQGVPADHVPQINARLPTVLARKPALVILDGGTNNFATDPPATATVAFVVSQRLALWQALADAGIWVIDIGMYPRADAFGGFLDSDTSTPKKKQRQLDAHNALKAAAANYPSVRFVDLWAKVSSDGTATSLNVNPLYFIEKTSGVHLNQAGTQVCNEGADPGTSLLAAIQAMIAAGDYFDKSPANSNLFPSSTWSLKGTNGGRTGTNTNVGTPQSATGTTARLFRAQTGESAALTKETISGDTTKERQVITITSAGGAAWSQFGLTFPDLVVNPATLLPGSWVRFYARIDASAGLPVGNINLNFKLLNSAAAVVLGGTDGQGVAGLIDSNVYSNVGGQASAARGRGVYWLASNPIQLPANGDYAKIATNLYINWWGAALGPAGTQFTVKVSDLILRAVPDPRVAWNY